MILAIETSSLVSSLALGNEDILKGELTVQAKLTHSEQLVPHIESLLAMCQIQKEELSSIAISNGPGSFTGLRIGLATATMLAYGLGIPLIAVETPLAMAYNLMYVTRPIVVWIDAQKKQVYEAIYRWDGTQMTSVQEVRVVQVEDRLAYMEEVQDEALFLGDGAHKYGKFLTEKGCSLAPAHLAIPRAQSLLAAASMRWAKGEYDDIHQVSPFYLRKSEAEVLWERKEAMKHGGHN